MSGNLSVSYYRIMVFDKLHYGYVKNSYYEQSLNFEIYIIKYILSLKAEKILNYITVYITLNAEIRSNINTDFLKKNL